MALSRVALLGLLLLGGLAIYKFIIEPIFLSPLSKIPNIHWSAPLSRLWILNERRQAQETFAVHAAHQRLGPIVRLAPNELSINSVDGGIRTVYSGSYEKGDWYRNIFNNYGVEPMFAMPEHGPHSQRKRMLSNVYAKSTLQSSPSMTAITRHMLEDRLMPRLRELSASNKPIEFYDIFSAATLDFVSAYVFGMKNGSNLLQDATMGAKFFRDYKARQDYQFWPQDLPRFTGWMRWLGLGGWIVPCWVDEANGDIEAMILACQDGAEKTVVQAEKEDFRGNPEDWPTVYAQLRHALCKEKKQQDQDKAVPQLTQHRRLEIASELLDHTLAGFDTSSITLTFLAYELSRPQHQSWQDQLRAEVSQADDTADAKSIDALPILHAVLMETLRLHTAIPGNQPRITPPNASLAGVSALPSRVRVQAQAWSLHRNPDVFPAPETWRPQRWMDSSPEQLREMHRWFWAFGSGGRMCVGNNLAMLDMKAMIWAIWRAFRTVLADGRGMVHNGGYVAGPLGCDGGFCLLKVEELTS